MKKVGVLFGQEDTFPWALIDRINSKNVEGITAEPVRIEKLVQGEATDYAVIFDRISQDIPFYRVPVPSLDAEEQPQWDLLDSNSAQDMAAWITQGAIADRSGEHLGRSDKGIILFRQMLEENIRRVEQGDDPINVFREPAANVYLSMRTERAGGHRYAGSRSRQGAATKYSPILSGRGVARPSDATAVEAADAAAAAAAAAIR